MTWNKIKKILHAEHKPNLKAQELLKYIGPGILVTVGFIDPGNWAANMAAGSDYGYTLLWVVTLSTIMLIILQHNVAHLGIVSGLCLSEAATTYLRPYISRIVLTSAVMAAIATALAEILGTAIALNMICGLPIKIGTLITALVAGWMLWTNSYRSLEKCIVGFVSLIGFALLFELSYVHIEWASAFKGWVVPVVNKDSLPIVMCVLGAVVMPHNLFLHSEIIQSRQWNLAEEKVINKQLKYEFFDTLFSMIIGWAINSAMILIAATTFYSQQIHVDKLEQAETMLRPILGSGAALVFAVALLFSGFSSTITSGMAGGSIFAGLFKEPYDIKDSHTTIGVFITYFVAVVLIFFITDPLNGLIMSQIMLSIQLPWTIFLQIYLTSSTKVMGKYANGFSLRIILWIIASIVTVLNIMLLFNAFMPISFP